MDTTAAATTTTIHISDGRRIVVEHGTSEHPIVMVQPDGSECGICHMTGTVDSAVKEATRIAKGIEFDLRWMAGHR